MLMLFDKRFVDNQKVLDEVGQVEFLFGKVDLS